MRQCEFRKWGTCGCCVVCLLVGCCGVLTAASWYAMFSLQLSLHLCKSCKGEESVTVLQRGGFECHRYGPAVLWFASQQVHAGALSGRHSWHSADAGGATRANRCGLICLNEHLLILRHPLGSVYRLSRLQSVAVKLCLYLRPASPPSPCTDPSLLPPGKDSRLVGTVSLSFTAASREDFDSLAPPADQPYLANMAVDPKFRR